MRSQAAVSVLVQTMCPVRQAALSSGTIRGSATIRGFAFLLLLLLSRRRRRVGK